MIRGFYKVDGDCMFLLLFVLTHLKPKPRWGRCRCTHLICTDTKQYGTVWIGQFLYVMEGLNCSYQTEAWILSWLSMFENPAPFIFKIKIILTCVLTTPDHDPTLFVYQESKYCFLVIKSNQWNWTIEHDRPQYNGSKFGKKLIKCLFFAETNKEEDAHYTRNSN